MCDTSTCILADILIGIENGNHCNLLHLFLTICLVIIVSVIKRKYSRRWHKHETSRQNMYSRSKSQETIILGLLVIQKEALNWKIWSPSLTLSGQSQKHSGSEHEILYVATKSNILIESECTTVAIKTHFGYVQAHTDEKVMYMIFFQQSW